MSREEITDLIAKSKFYALVFEPTESLKAKETEPDKEKYVADTGGCYNNGARCALKEIAKRLALDEVHQKELFVLIDLPHGG